MSYPQQQRSMFGPGGMSPLGLAAVLQATQQQQPQQAPPMTPDQQMSFGMLTGGQTAPSAPGAASAAETEIMAEARRRLGQQSAHQSVLDLRQKQWMEGKRSAADGFLPGEEDWVKKNQHLIGSQGNRASGMAREDVVFSGDGYKTIFDKNGRAIGTNRPTAAVQSMPDETPGASRSIFNRGGGTAAEAQGNRDFIANQFYNPPAGVQQYVQESRPMLEGGGRAAENAPAAAPFTFGRENLVDTFRKAAGMSAADPGTAGQGPLRSAALPQGMSMEQVNAALGAMEQAGGIGGKPGEGPAFAGAEQKSADADRAEQYRLLDQAREALSKDPTNGTLAGGVASLENTIKKNVTRSSKEAAETMLPQWKVDKWDVLNKARDIALPGVAPAEQAAPTTLEGKKAAAAAAVAGQSAESLTQATAKAEAIMRDPKSTPAEAEAARAETVKLRMDWIKKLPPEQRAAELKTLLGTQTVGDVIAETKGAGNKAGQVLEAIRLDALDTSRRVGSAVSDWWTGSNTPKSDSLWRYLAELKLKREAAK